MNTKERIELKRKLREIAKSESPMNMNTCDYFKQIFDEVKPTQNEITNMIYYMIKDYYYNIEDHELTIIEFLMQHLTHSNKGHLKLSVLYLAAMYNSCEHTFKLLLKYDIQIVDEVFESAKRYVAELKTHKFMYPYIDQDEATRMYETIYSKRRIQQIGHLKTSIQAQKCNSKIASSSKSNN